MPRLILIRGAGDLASGIATRLVHSGFQVTLTELPKPLAIRRTVSFSEAVYDGQATVEGVTAHRIENPFNQHQIFDLINHRRIPILIDPNCASATPLNPLVVVDARMTKLPPAPIDFSPELLIGLGPGFVAGQNCQAVVETQRGHWLGRLIWQGSPQPDTRSPAGDQSRVLRAPCDGVILWKKNIADQCQAGDLLGEIASTPLACPIEGVIRGLIRPGIPVAAGTKIADIDPRREPLLCQFVSDKSLAVAGGVLEAILSHSSAILL